MKDTRLPSDDPKLTAYALGELNGDERAAIEAALRENPALRRIVDEIRATATELEVALGSEPIIRPTLSHVAKPGIIVAINQRSVELAPKASVPHSPPRTARQRPMVNGGETYQRAARSKLLKFPQFYYVIATAAAACFAVLVAFHDKPPAAPARPTVRTPPPQIALQPLEQQPLESPAALGLEPVDMRIAEASMPPNASPAQTESAQEGERTQNTGTTGTGTAFIGGNLSLIGQASQIPIGAAPDADRAPNLARTERTADVAVSGGDTSGAPRTRVSSLTGIDVTFRETRPVAVPLTTRGLLGEAAAGMGNAGTSMSAPLSRPLFSEALAPPVAGPVVAASTVPSLLPNQGAAGRSIGTTNVPGSGDVVMLSPFTVTADRATGFALGSNSSSSNSDRRTAINRDERPYAPPGAKFGRKTESYSHARDNDFLLALQHRLSSFALDVDTGSYANVRRIIEHGSPPPRDAVRIEEMLNYFPYRYAAPRGETPFAVSMEVAQAPWAPTHRIVRIGLKARDAAPPQRAPANLVFLLDVSGSMDQPNKLPLVKQSLRLLLGKLKPADRVAIVTYAGNSGLALPSTPVSHVREIMNALDALAPGGSPTGAVGIQLAYDIAKANFVRQGINRVILCTDGDFNLGVATEGELVRLVGEKAESGVRLTVLGFGMGNYKDSTLEKLAATGNGNFGYIDTRREAEKLLAEQIGGTVMTVARDVKLQVEFNPATVSSHRLIGYENRLLRKEDFNSDRGDAGEIAAGHSVTALYEIVPVGAEDYSGADIWPVDQLRYATRGAATSRLQSPRDLLSDELLTVKVRYKKPDSLFSFPKTLQFPLINATKGFANATADFRFAAAVAQFGMILRGSPHRGSASLAEVAEWAAAAASTPNDDPGGFRAEFVELVRKAQTMME
jgi:secreted protein with Ig-like and vWFA domain